MCLLHFLRVHGQMRKQVVELTASVHQLCSNAPSMPDDLHIDSADEESDEEVTDATTPANLAKLDALQVCRHALAHSHTAACASDPTP